MVVQGARKVGAARERVLAVAQDLFSRHGVSGTSLQMIADELGVTKAAVYFQFQSKEDIVLAVISPSLDHLVRVTEAAEARPTLLTRRETVLSGLVDVIIANRRLSAMLRSDPAVRDVLASHPDLQALGDRLSQLLMGSDPDPGTRVAVAMVTGGMMAIGTDPLLVELDDQTLRNHFLATARRLLRMRTPAPVPAG